jgi:hypothetical protein
VERQNDEAERDDDEQADLQRFRERDHFLHPPMSG